MSSSEVDGFCNKFIKDTFKQSQSQLYFIILILRSKLMNMSSGTWHKKETQIESFVPLLQQSLQLLLNCCSEMVHFDFK